MSASFWNMRRRLRQQLGIERVIEEEKVVADIAAAQASVEEKKNADAENATAKNPTARKTGARNDGRASKKS